jgi:hypothetical protein
MNITNESLLITTAPIEILLGLGLLFCIAGLILFVLSLEDSSRENPFRRIKSLGKINIRIGYKRRHWLFIPNVYHTLIEGNEYGHSS